MGCTDGSSWSTLNLCMLTLVSRSQFQESQYGETFNCNGVGTRVGVGGSTFTWSSKCNRSESFLHCAARLRAVERMARHFFLCVPFLHVGVVVQVVCGIQLGCVRNLGAISVCHV